MSGCCTDIDNICKCHPLRAVCVLIQALEAHLTRRQWISPVLADLIPNTTKILFQDQADHIKRTGASPLIAYQMAGETLSKTNFGAMNPEMRNQSIVGVDVTLEFTVSTNSKGLTRELAFELAGFLMAVSGAMREDNASILGASVAPVEKDEANQYFLTKVSAKMGCGYHIWQTQLLESTVREVRIIIEDLYNKQLNK